MEVSGKKTEKDKGVGINLCEPCKDDNYKTKADGVCQECKEFMCQTCFKDHLKARVCRNHMLVDSGQFPKSNEEVEDNIKCEKHPAESVRFYCRNHKAAGCGDCMLLDHKLCAHEYIRDIAKDFPESSEFKAFKEKLDNSVVKVNDRLKATSAKKLLVLELERKAVEKIKQFRKDIDSFLNKAEKETLAKLKECASENNTRLSNYEKEMMTLKIVTEEVKSQIDASHGIALFVTAEEHKEIPGKIAEKVTLADANTSLDDYDFVADAELQKLISKPKPLGCILRKKESSQFRKQESNEETRSIQSDVAKPSPRVTKGKGRSSSVASKDAMPDPKSLRDWSHSTSKGCFFYEEDEVETHVYSLKLAEDSMVYLCAYPIQEPACLNLPGTEPVDTALFVFDSRGKLVTCTEDRDTKGTYGVKCELLAGQYEILPYTTGCRFRQRGEEGQHNFKESKLVKTKDDKVVITTAFRKALEDIFDLCDLDNNGTMSRDEFNWFNLRTSGENLGEDEWEVVEEKTALKNGEITKKGFIELNEMEAEDAAGDVEDLWVTLASMGMNKGLIMDEACPFRVDVYVESARKTPRLKVTGIESIEKKEYRSEICQYIIKKADEPVKIRSMKDLYKYTYKTDLKASIVIDNRSRSSVNLEVDCSKSKNAISNRSELKHSVEINPQDVIIAHHLMPKSELRDWTVTSTEEIHK